MAGDVWVIVTWTTVTPCHVIMQRNMIVSTSTTNVSARFGPLGSAEVSTSTCRCALLRIAMLDASRTSQIIR